MSHEITDDDWNTLLSRIDNGKCTPFLGAGACYGTLPMAAEIANSWTIEYGYPLDDANDLSKVAEFVAHKTDDITPKEKIIASFKDAGIPDYKDFCEPHGLVAYLPIPVYMTTNYDSFIYKALQIAGKEPKRIICQWNNFVEEFSSEYKLPKSYIPSANNPIIFHLHGIDDVLESIVLTETDYINFMVNVSRDQKNIIPHQIQRALTGSSLLFLGYSLKDWNFRVVFQGLVNQMSDGLRRLSVAVQLPREDKEQEAYLNTYFGHMKIKVFWGTAKEFAKELRERWDNFK